MPKITRLLLIMLVMAAPAAAEQISLPLQNGWNMISLPVVLQKTGDISISGCQIERILAFEPNEGWKLTVAEKNDKETIRNALSKTGKGFLVYNSAPPCSAAFAGAPAKITDTDLPKGWNLLAGGVKLSSSCVLHEKVAYGLAYDSSGKKYKYLEGDTKDFVGADGILGPSKTNAYMVYVGNDGCRASAGEAAGKKKPDLMIESVNFVKSAAGELAANVLVKNAGGADTPVTSDNLIFVLNTATTFGQLKAGESITIPIPLPSNIVNGQEIAFRIDPNNVIGESDETNNEFRAVVATTSAESAESGKSDKPVPSIENIKSESSGNDIIVTVNAKGLLIETLELYTNHGVYVKGCERQAACSNRFVIPKSGNKELEFIAVAYDIYGVQSSGIRGHWKGGDEINFMEEKITVGVVTSEGALIKRGNKQINANKGVLTEFDGMMIFVSDVYDKDNAKYARMYLGKDKVTAITNICSAASQFDLNSDGKTDGNDANICKPHMDKEATEESKKCDFNGDCKIDFKDLAMQASKVSGKDAEKNSDKYNLALGKAASASFNSDMAGNAVDGDTTDKNKFWRPRDVWNSEGKKGDWWHVDLEGIYKISSAVVYSFAGNYHDWYGKFHIEVSETGKFEGEQKTVATETDWDKARVGKQFVVYSFNPVEARYARIVSDTDQNFVKLQEVEVYETLPSSYACEVPKALSCAADPSDKTYSHPSWSAIESASSYRLEWCYNDFSFEETDFKSGNCGFITGNKPNVQLHFPPPIRDLKYKIRARVESSNQCKTPGAWSAALECNTCAPSAAYDINKDGKVDKMDVDSCSKYAAQDATLENAACDFDGNCKIDSADSELHKNKINVPVIEKIEFDKWVLSWANAKIKVTAKGANPLRGITLFSNQGAYEAACDGKMECSKEFTIVADGNLGKLKFIAVAWDNTNNFSPGKIWIAQKNSQTEFNGGKIQIIDIIDADPKRAVLADGKGQFTVKMGEWAELGDTIVFVRNIDGGADIYLGRNSDVNTIDVIDFDAVVTPSEASKDTTFQMKARAIPGMEISAQLPAISSRIFLYDDGEHGDDRRNDGIYGNTISGYDLGNGIHNPSIKMQKDGKAIEISPANAIFSVSEGKCSEVVSGHNDVSSKRVNIVFLGFGYSKNEFSGLVSNAVTGKLFSMLSVEPFKSNKDKFNFWYVPVFSDMPKEIEKPAGEKSLLTMAKDKVVLDIIVKRKASACKVKNPVIINLVKLEAYAGYAVGKGVAFVYYNQEEVDDIHMITEGISALVTHEFLHAFAFLQDEYEGGNIPILDHRPIQLSLKILTGLDLKDNLIVVNSKEECLEKAPWKDMIGNGCGKDGIIDCVDADSNKCISGNPWCALEIGCFNVGDKHFKPTTASVMLGWRLYKNKDFLVQPVNSRILGQYNEKLVCQRIKETTGSAEGICNNYKLK